MGKRQHQGVRFVDIGCTDKIKHCISRFSRLFPGVWGIISTYIRPSEWAAEFGGKKLTKGRKAFKRLPFDCCALSLRPFENPVATPEGIVFDLVNIVPYVRKHKKNPVNGEPLKLKQLKKLTFHKNVAGKYHCPITNKEFSEHTHIVALWTSGNVYAYEAIEELNIKQKNMHDLLTGQAFKRSDIISIQDPHNFSDTRNITSFLHRKKKNEDEEKKVLVKTVSKSGKSTDKKKSGSKKSVPMSRYTSGLCSGSFTSTAMTPVTANQVRPMTKDEIREERYKEMRGKNSTKPAYVQISTSKGNLNVMLYVSKAPRTCHNFLELCKTGYYKGVMFHRLIKKFMIQGGDPTGTGRGGRSAWGKKFKDEIDKSLSHNKRGILSMANSGKDTNGSQFFITFAPAKHLDGKHSIFGEVVGGLHIFQNPFDVPWVPKQIRRQQEEEKKKEEEKRIETTKRSWFSAPAPKMKAVREGVTIGKYMSLKRIKPPKDSDVESKFGALPKKRKKAWGNIGKYF
ncbi:hypothetical protein AAMO2058_001291000 [Amorphochlora amoebiformis]